MSLIDQLEITIPGKPVPKGRPRFNMKTGRIYTPKATSQAEFYIRQWIATNHYPYFQKYNDFKGMVHLNIEYHLKYPSHLKMSERVERTFHKLKPDLDNFVKLTIDAINKVLFEDDSQIGMITAQKLQTDNPRTIIEISYYE